MQQKIEPFNANDLSRVEAQRKWVREHYEPDSEHKYDTVEGKIALLDGIIQNKWIEPSETVKLQSLGITLGDAFVQHLGFKWMSVEDEYGRDPAIVLEGTSIVLFPLTMILKRIERGDNVDVYDIFTRICAKMEELKEEMT